MSESEPKGDLSAKEIAHYEVLLTAYIDSRNELDRQMLTLSVAGLGALLAFSKELTNASCFHRSAITISAIVFVLNIALLLKILSLNAEFAAAEISSDQPTIDRIQPTMVALDLIAKVLLILGIGLSTTSILIQVLE